MEGVFSFSLIRFRLKWKTRFPIINTEDMKGKKVRRLEISACPVKGQSILTGGSSVMVEARAM